MPSVARKPRTSAPLAPKRVKTATAPAGRRIHSFPGGQEVTEREGKLWCSCPTFGKSGWCPHVQDVMQQALDAKDFVLIPNDLVVPVFPTKKFSATVEVSGVEDDGSRRVSFNSMILGWIWPGEGRNIVRNMMLEWLRSQYRTAGNCKSSVHKSITWSASDTHNDDLASRNLADLWSIIFHEECLTCHQFSNFDSDAPEL